MLQDASVDASLEELVAALDAPVHPRLQSGATGARGAISTPPIPQGGASAPLSGPASLSKPVPGGRPGGKRKRRVRGGLPPAWLVDVSGIDFAQQRAQGTLGKLSVKELKSFLYDQDEALAGVKAVLVGRVEEVLDRLGSSSGGNDGIAADPVAPPLDANAGVPSRLNGASHSGSGAAAGAAAIAGEELTLFQQESGDTREDDLLIDEVFSAM